MERQLTEARQQLSEMNVEAERTRGRLEAQVKESGAIEQRIAQAARGATEDVVGRTHAALETAGALRPAPSADPATVPGT